MTRRRRFWLGVLLVLIFTGTGTLIYSYAMPAKTGKPGAGGAAGSASAKRFAAGGADTNLVRVSGVGVVQEDTAQGRLLARRAALADARRKLLELRQELIAPGSPSFKSGTISGYVPGATQRITAERIENGRCLIEVEMSLEALAENYFDEKIFIYE